VTYSNIRSHILLSSHMLDVRCEFSHVGHVATLVGHPWVRDPCRGSHQRFVICM
jgi:hypothetical protein